jgi:hypothetical protein
MYAHRQIYESIQSVIAVPPELQHRKTEVIFVVHWMMSQLISLKKKV